MELNIEPYVGLGPIRFGMSVLDVRAAVPLPVRSFQKTVADDHATDAFDELGVHVYYDAAGICEAAECFAPCAVTYQGKDLLHMPYGDLVEWTRSLDPEVDVDDTGFTSFLLGFGVFAPNGQEEPQLVPEGVIVFKKDYYGAFG